MDWLKAAEKFLVGTYPNRPAQHNKIYIEAVYQEDETILWAVRTDGMSVLTKPEFDNGTLHFLIERDFRGKDKKFIRFKTKEEAYDAYLQWKEQKHET